MSTNIHKELTSLRSQLEYWNNGLWGIGHWFIRKITVDMGASMLVAKSSSLRSTFQYSIIPWPRPDVQGWRSMGTASEILQQQKAFPRKSHQGGPIFHVLGKGSSLKKSLYFQ
jgi:hypothetical protein